MDKEKLIKEVEKAIKCHYKIKEKISKELDIKYSEDSRLDLEYWIGKGVAYQEILSMIRLLK